MGAALFILVKTDLAVTKVVHAVPLAQEGVSQNGQGTNGLRKVHAHEGAHAAALDLQGVVVGGDGEVVTAQLKGEVRQRGPLLAVNVILAHEVLSGTDLLVTVQYVSSIRVG